MVKIGKTKDLKTRLWSLQAGFPVDGEFSYVLNHEDSYSVEAEAHCKLKQHALGREWISISPAAARDAILEAKETIEREQLEMRTEAVLGKGYVEQQHNILDVHDPKHNQYPDLFSF